jgi:hypothetical protein
LFELALVEATSMTAVVSVAGSVLMAKLLINQPNITMARHTDFANGATRTKPFVTFWDVCRFHRRIKAPKMISPRTAIAVHQRTHVSTSRAMILVQLTRKCQGTKEKEDGRGTHRPSSNGIRG